jgi:nucleolar MIF4G domain-containing protein 1
MRLKFMFEELDDIRNNKKTVNLFDKFMPILNWLQSHSQLKNIANAKLSITLADLKMSIGNPLWFTKKLVLQSAPLTKKSDEQIKIEQAAEKLHLKTELKKAIFYCIASSFDAEDAAIKLNSLKLTEIQQRDFPRVALLMCNHEKQYNPYYANIIAILCKSNSKHKYSTQFAVWDNLRISSTFSKAALLNLCKCLLSLILSNCINLGCLRIIDIINCDQQQRKIYRFILMSILKQYIISYRPCDTLKKIISKIKGKDELEDFRFKLKAILKNLIRKTKDDITDIEEKGVILSSL